MTKPLADIRAAVAKALWARLPELPVGGISDALWLWLQIEHVVDVARAAESSDRAMIGMLVDRMDEIWEHHLTDAERAWLHVRCGMKP